MKLVQYREIAGALNRDVPMGIGILLTGGVAGFFSAVLAGLVLGLTILECAVVYSVTGITVALAIFTVRGIYCAAARQFT